MNELSGSSWFGRDGTELVDVEDLCRSAVVFYFSGTPPHTECPCGDTS